ncbi:DUF2919 domain-containing protein [Aestuariibacter salexigens]|uniref:DUF2919 domain-containing protein n=1 Tax=Aestuariibacter salexigens TaxID=226010 RepID=UPI0003F9801C|nr:DUF2919 domain-containing protein [Aestuariibacter salexigens]
MKLELPLSSYDEAGRVKPPAMWYAVLIFLARAYVIAIAVFSSSQPVEQTMDFFYPTHELFYAALAMGLPALVLFGLTSIREKLYGSRLRALFRVLLPGAFACLCVDMWLLISKLSVQHWQFAWSTALTLLVQIALLLYVVKSRHLRLMIADWRRSD